MNEPDLIVLTLDGLAHSVPLKTTLAALVASLGHVPDKVSTAVNGLFVPRALRDARLLEEGDAVLLFQPIVGG